MRGKMGKGLREQDSELENCRSLFADAGMEQRRKKWKKESGGEKV